ncbi:hypothetical protein BDR03DRAFT_1030460 [Suillus americanus]|nr:hypothetical protein BDR03DRAFT_1030460 [Suillus americanus]
MNDTLSVLTSHFIGVIISSMFYGFTLAQTWRYFHTYPKDRWSTKALVAFLWALDTAQLALVATSIYQYTIVWQGGIATSSHISKTFEASMGITSIIAFLVQLTYVYRIWRLSFGNIMVTSFIALLALTALGSGAAMVVETVRDPLWDSTHVSNLPASSFYLSSMACDFLIAATQVYLFQRSRAGRGRLGGLITRLTVLVVNVGLITTIDVTLFLILFLVCPRNGVFLVPYILMSHCYLNSFLSVTLVAASTLLLQNWHDDINTALYIYATATSSANILQTFWSSISVSWTSIDFPSIMIAARAKAWIDSEEGFEIICEAFESTSRFIKLQRLMSVPGCTLFVQFATCTGGAGSVLKMLRIKRPVRAKYEELRRNQERLRGDEQTQKASKSELEEKLAALKGDHARSKQDYENQQSERTRISRLETETNEKLADVYQRLLQAGVDRNVSEREAKLKETLASLQRIFPGVRGRVVELCKPHKASTRQRYPSSLGVMLTLSPSTKKKLPSNASTCTSLPFVIVHLN